MYKLSGLVLDLYDDGGATVATATTLQELPDYIKEAHALTTDEQAKLPDDVYALVLHSHDGCLRKYACTDAGNTALNVAYFMQYGHKLPKAAQKVAAANLLTACGWYGLQPPAALQKVAGAVSATRKIDVALQLPSYARDIKRNVNVAFNTPELPQGVSGINPGVLATHRPSIGGR